MPGGWRLLYCCRLNRNLRTLAFCILLLAGGCAQRTLSVTSQPSGALVYLNGQEVGRTPMKYDFMWYGDYDVVLRLDGHETLKTNRKLSAPLLGIPPLDLFGELVGHKDHRDWHFDLTPADPKAAEPQGLLSHAAELKGALRSSKFTRQPKTQPATAPITRPATASGDLP